MTKPGKQESSAPVKIIVQFSALEGKQIEHYALKHFTDGVQGGRQALIRFATKKYISELVKEEEKGMVIPNE